MKYINEQYGFGFWEGMPYSNVTDEYEDFLTFKNDIDKETYS
jgi:hypothetical protein